MSLFEWIGEAFDPRPSGEVECGSRIREYRSRMVVFACGVISVGLLAGWNWMTCHFLHVQSWTGVLNCLAITTLYLVAGYFIHPAPDTENLGWFGGLFDDPFHWSDDYNRILLFLQIVLWPGRFLSQSIVDSSLLLIGASHNEKRVSKKKRQFREREIATPRNVKDEY